MRRLAVLGFLVACNLAPADEVRTAQVAPASTHAGSARPAVDPWANPTPPPPSPLTHADAPALPYVELPNPPPPAEPPLPAARSFGPAPRPPGLHAIVAPPSQGTRALAVLPDGSAAASADVAGSVRLWPTLDGTREPVVVAMRRPVALAMMRSGTNVVIAGLDGAGQLELVTTSALGEAQAREAIALPRPAIAVFATTKGFLVERDDQHLFFVQAHWAPTPDLEPPPGTHIAAIAVNGDAMLVLLAGADGVYGRWLGLDKGLRWGDKTPALKIAPSAIALAPNHTVIAATGYGNHLVTVSLATGKTIEQSPDGDFNDSTMAPIGFVDASSVLVHFTGFTSLWHTDTGTFAEMSEDRRGNVVALGGARAIFGEGADLMIVDAAGTQHYLGFRISTLSLFAPSAHALLATDGQQLVRIGADLREHTSYDLPKPHGEGYSVMTLLDANHVLAQSYQRETFVDIVTLDSMDVTPVTGPERFIAYDLATRTAAFADSTKLTFRRFDGATATFGKGAELDADNVSSVTFNGDRATVTMYRSDGTYAMQTVTHIRAEAGTLTAGRAVTRFVESDGNGNEVLPELPPITHTAKSPDGALVASVGAGRMSLRDADGTVRWTVPAAGALDVMWLRSGELLATGAGIGRVDLETGAYTDRRCGWEFGLWTEPVNQFASTMMCEAE